MRVEASLETECLISLAMIRASFSPPRQQEEMTGTEEGREKEDWFYF